ncbi:MAG TPA: alpha-L-glutamate ligase-like protein [Methanosarcinales archaeon]|nr:MAG: alpha-L-glutamate ligase-like protein [Methanosarcinales archaeon]HDN65182.1 alpha-L-glutamate ligase-like protein [Methanosarcinales archaeon]
MITPLSRLFGKNKEVVGINARNIGYIFAENPRKLLSLVDDKLKTKELLESVSIPFPGVYGVFSEIHELRNLEKVIDRDEFVIKPSSGAGGRGIVVIKGRVDRGWVKSSGKTISLAEIRKHCSEVLEGVYSLDGNPTPVFFESLIKSHHALAEVSFEGVPDVRIISYRGVPVMAMVRLPTRESSGKANLHQGALGAGIRISGGHTIHAIRKDKPVHTHPDTGSTLIGVEIPFWDEILEISSKSYDAVGLGYLGVDVAIDEETGPLVLELNARPGLSIQNANQCGLARRLEVIEAMDLENVSSAERVAIAVELDTKDWVAV